MKNAFFAKKFIDQIQFDDLKFNITWTDALTYFSHTKRYLD